MAPLFGNCELLKTKKKAVDSACDRVDLFFFSKYMIVHSVAVLRMPTGALD